MDSCNDFYHTYWSHTCMVILVELIRLVEIKTLLLLLLFQHLCAMIWLNLSLQVQKTEFERSLHEEGFFSFVRWDQLIAVHCSKFHQIIHYFNQLHVALTWRLNSCCNDLYFILILFWVHFKEATFLKLSLKKIAKKTFLKTCKKFS